MSLEVANMKNDKELQRIHDKVVSFANRHWLINDYDTVVVATSGGADSMALLMFMNKFKDDFAHNVNVVACTVNHGIRGETSKRDMEYVQNKCKTLDIRCITFDASTDGTVVPDDASEEWARQLRYNYFKKLPEILGVDENSVKIATAHTMSDEAETVLFRMSRNSSYKSLMGIPAKREMFIRPFLSIERGDTEKLCEIFGIEYMTDETNLTDDYCRNKIRHHVIPVLKQINDKAVEHLAELAEFNQKINDYFLGQAYRVEDKASTGRNRYNIHKIIENDPLVIEAFINYLMEKYGIQPSKVNMQLVYDMIHKVEGAVELSKDVTFYVEQYNSKGEQKCELVVAVKENSVKQTEITEEMLKDFVKDGKCRSVVVNGSGTFKAHIIEWPIESAPKLLKGLGIRQLANMVSYDKLFKSGWTFESTCMNDKFKPACRNTQKVTKLYHEMDIVNKMANSVPCIKDTSGNVVWLYGVGFTDGMTIMDKDGNINDDVLKSDNNSVFYMICNY